MAAQSPDNQNLVISIIIRESIPQSSLPTTLGATRYKAGRLCIDPHAGMYLAIHKPTARQCFSGTGISAPSMTSRARGYRSWRCGGF